MHLIGCQTSCDISKYTLEYVESHFEDTNSALCDLAADGLCNSFINTATSLPSAFWV